MQAAATVTVVTGIERVIAATAKHLAAAGIIEVVIAGATVKRVLAKAAAENTVVSAVAMEQIPAGATGNRSS